MIKQKQEGGGGGAITVYKVLRFLTRAYKYLQIEFVKSKGLFQVGDTGWVPHSLLNFEICACVCVCVIMCARACVCVCLRARALCVCV